MSNTKTVMGQASNQYVVPLDITDVFSTYLYEGNGSTQTITNGIDLAGEGGLTWIKGRDFATGNLLFDTERGALQRLISNGTNASENVNFTLTSFNSDGFSVGDSSTLNGNIREYASWTFRKAPKFFTCLTYTGTGPGSAANEQQVSHDLGAKPGIVIIKRTDATGDWWVFTDVIDGSNDYGYLNQTAAFGNSGNNVATDSVFSVGGILNTSGATYTAYLFANNDGDGGFGPDGSDIIKCGSYNGNSSTQEIDLGFEPQWILIKKAVTESGGYPADWFLFDSMRGMPVNGSDALLYPNEANAEASSEILSPQPTGFKLETVAGSFNATGATYIYIAIRRGPLAPPESATEVFTPFQGQSSGGFVAGFPVDMFIAGYQPGGESAYPLIAPRLTAGNFLTTSSTAAESSGNAAGNWDNMTFVGNTGNESSKIAWLWKRAPGYFDAVAYTGNGVRGRTVSHNLGVVPEMMWIKNRDDAQQWLVYIDSLGGTQKLYLSSTSAIITASIDDFNNTNAEATQFTLGNDGRCNANNQDYIAYLFASLPGISKVGSFTGNGTTINIDCGFTSGARFVMTKRTDIGSDWVVWDTARGIVAGNDPVLVLNDVNEESSTLDSIDPYSSGFSLNYDGVATNISGSSYIFYAIA